MIWAVLGTIAFFLTYVLIINKAGAKKQPKPGKHYDERGPY